MSFQAMAWAVEQQLATREKFVLIMLANYASNEAWDCYPSINTLSTITSMSRDTVIRAIKELEGAGFLTIVRRTMDGINLPNIYRLNRNVAMLQGVVAVGDQGSSCERPGVVAGCDSNQSFEPVIDPNKSPAEPATRDPIPYEQIRELYNNVLGNHLPRRLGTTEADRKRIRGAYNLKINGKFIVREGGIAFWDGLFHDALDSEFLLGSNGRTWRADFEFMTRGSAIQNFMEGKYDAR